LFGNWRGPREGLIHMGVRPIVIREANRRIAYGAERLVFYHADEEWMANLRRILEVNPAYHFDWPPEDDEPGDVPRGA
jgi:hypothetical protein